MLLHILHWVNVIPNVLKGDLDLSKEEITKRGGNSSMIHIDWMIGSNQIDVDGIDQNGNSKPVFRKGEWAN